MSNLLSRRQAGTRILSAGVAGIGVAAMSQAAQPNMEEAITHLKEARESLLKATANKGGHRANAIKLIDQAIDQVKQGIAAAS